MDPPPLGYFCTKNALKSGDLATKYTMDPAPLCVKSVVFQACFAGVLDYIKRVLDVF